MLGGGYREREREGELNGKIWKCRKKTVILYVSRSVLTSVFFPFFRCVSFSLVLLVFIVITMAAPLESSTFFSTGAINEEGLTPFSSSSSPFSSLLQVPPLAYFLTSHHILLRFFFPHRYPAFSYPDLYSLFILFVNFNDFGLIFNHPLVVYKSHV